MKIALLYAGGIFFLCLAYYFYLQYRVERACLTVRDVSDFVGDIQSWLHSESH